MRHHKTILSFIRRHIRENGIAPSFREIVNATSLNMLTVHCSIHAMLMHGQLKHSGATKRYVVIPN